MTGEDRQKGGYGMKVLYCAVILGMLICVMMPNPADATRVPKITGCVKTEDTLAPMPDLEIAFINQRTLETIYDITNENGYYCILLDDFSDWETGDFVKIDPNEMPEYYACHAMVYLSPYVADYSYTANLWGTPLMFPDHAQVSVGWMYATNRNIQKSQAAFGYVDNAQIHVDKRSKGVDIIVDPSFSDDGTGLPREDWLYFVDISWEMWTRQTGDPLWNMDQYSSASLHYEIKSTTSQCGNPNMPANLVEPWTKQSLLLKNVDIKIRLSVQYDYGDYGWQLPAQGELILSNINFIFDA